MGTLSEAAAEHYREHGYYAPIRVMPASEAEGIRRRLEAHEAAHGALKGSMRHKGHLLFTWLDGLIRHPSILDAVEGVVGPDILCWSSTFFIKEPYDPAFVSWHQDSTYWGLDPADIVTAWVALSESTPENGAMRVIPGTQKLAQVAHRDTFAADNLLTRGQEIEVDVDGSKAVMLSLQPGEMSLHHVRLIHGSDPNPSAKRRIGFAIRYLPTHVRQIEGTRDSATLVRGIDRFGNFERETSPERDLSEAAVALHAHVMGDQQKVLMKNAPTSAIR
ncbi:phytanoyl-CoA dioxygenase family protein [Bradyrhizobium roseum]|uniref:phytanoyl-CoA dioxygenase family protein n=1 Tax=Bradyrhizobium roseum TaxID=3056648 RepID=UPI0026286FEE|nr:phytanoyl-CoA dioxygenase family protein [Bradyrhizobium roseus]WKA29533.1 phytanoyl-CoA dioxygenase family protein [Bradyrhizobium roseus]